MTVYHIKVWITKRHTYNRASCAPVHKLPQIRCGDNGEGALFSWLHMWYAYLAFVGLWIVTLESLISLIIYIYIYIYILYIYVLHIYLYIYIYITATLLKVTFLHGCFHVFYIVQLIPNRETNHIYNIYVFTCMLALRRLIYFTCYLQLINIWGPLPKGVCKAVREWKWIPS